MTLNPHKVKMYVCGPTTYNFIHLGNARPIVLFDTVRRYLEYRGYKVHYVQNFTDVDDKIIKRAKEENEEPLALASRYIKEYFKDADALGIKRADIHPRVSEHIPDIINAITKLIDTGYAYEVEGDVYYRVKAFKEYGKLSGRTLEDMLSGARVDVDDRKEEAFDFALWKAAKPGEPAWDSPWGKGRPGWHIECSVMSTKYLGDTLDIHGGGSDLIFPHHENEIAQSEALTGKTFVKYWMHNGFITVNNEKMSKSLGNFFILRDILDKYPADVVRFYLIATHYRSPLDFDDTKLEEAKKALGRLKTTLTLAEEVIQDTENIDENLLDQEVTANIEGFRDQFIEAMDDDFNTAKAIGYLFEISHTLNSYIAKSKHNQTQVQATVKYGLRIFKELGNILGIFITVGHNSDEKLEEVLDVYLNLRQNLRKQKNFTYADKIRSFLNEQNILIEDTPQGSRVKYDKLPQVENLINWLISLRGDFKELKDFNNADYIRDSLKEKGILLEDTKEGVRWKIAQA